MSRKLYLEACPAPRLYLDLPGEPVYKGRVELKGDITPEMIKSFQEEWDALYLNLEKANPFREPTKGQFMHGGAVKANTEDLSETLSDLLGGEELKKED